MVRMGVADVCPLIREGLRGLLRKNVDVSLSWESDDPAQLRECLAKRPVQVLLIEPFVDRNSAALRLLEKLRQEFHRTALLVYTHLSAEDFAIAALRVGAAGVLRKTCSVKEISSALSTVLAGKTYLSSSQAHQISLNYLSGEDRGPLQVKLSRREREVLDGIISGKPLKEIGTDLSLSPKTVHTYKTRIMVRLKVKNTAALIQLGSDIS